MRYIGIMMKRLRVMLSVVVCAVGVVATAATSPASTGGVGAITAESSSVEVVLGAGDTSALVGEVAIVGLTQTAGNAEVAASIAFDASSVGSVTMTIAAGGQSETVDIADAATQGETRIAIPVFAACASACTEPLTITVARTDDQAGDLLANVIVDFGADADPQGSATATVSIRNQ
jgi:hypothetical protein